VFSSFYDLALELVNDELDRIWKELAVAQSGYNPYMLVELLGSCVWVWIQT
jgi:hypothetical protein